MTVGFKPDGCSLVAAGQLGNLYHWKIDRRQEIAPSAKRTKPKPKPALKGIVYATAVSRDGRWIVTGDSEKRVAVWKAVSNRISVEDVEHTGCVYAVDVSGDSMLFASGSEDCTVRVFNIISGVRVFPPLHHNGPVVGVKFSPDSSQIATATYSYASIRIYDAHSGNNLFDIPVTVTSKQITPLAWSSDGQHLFVASSGRITSFDTATSFRSEWPIHNDNIHVSIVTHGKYIACSASSSVSFWDYTSHEQVGSIIEHAEPVNCTSISHDGRYLACGHDKGITIHNLGDFLPREHLPITLVSRVPLMQVSEAVFKSWTLGNPADTESILSEEIAQFSNPSHHALAVRSLIRAHLRDWEAALEDAKMVRFSVFGTPMFT